MKKTLVLNHDRKGLIMQYSGRLIFLLAIGGLSACSTISDLPSGTPLSAIEQKYGKATLSCPADTPHRYIWSSQPMGQYAWAVELDPQQQLQHVEQVLSDAAFARLDQGRWSKEDVLCHFGPPAEKDITPYKGVKMQVWSYRYKENKAWDSLMYIYFDDDGFVQLHHPGPDPLFQADGWLIMR